MGRFFCTCKIASFDWEGRLNPETCYWNACTKPGTWMVMNLCVPGIDVDCLRFWYWTLELFWQCGVLHVFIIWLQCVQFLIWGECMSMFYYMTIHISFIWFYLKAWTFLVDRTLWILSKPSIPANINFARSRGAFGMLY
jgi:hypothetical protein